MILLEVIREFYEAYTIFSFFRLLQEALRKEADTRHSGRGSEAYDSLQDLGAGRPSFVATGTNEGTFPLLAGGGGGSINEGAGGGGGAGRKSLRHLLQRTESMLGVEELPEDRARLDTMLKLEVSDAARHHYWVSKMMNFVFKTRDSVFINEELCIQNDEFCSPSACAAWRHGRQGTRG